MGELPEYSQLRDGGEPPRRAAGFFVQFILLMRKNFLLALRNWKATLGQLLVPIAIVAILFGFQQVANLLSSRDDMFPSATPLSPSFSPCRARNGLHCKTVQYGPQGSPWVEQLMRQVAEDVNLPFDEHFFGIGSATPNITVEDFFADNTTLYMNLLNEPNVTAHAVLFHSAYRSPLPDKGALLPQWTGRIEFFNSTAKASESLEFKRAVDEVLMRMKMGSVNDTLNLSIKTKKFPKPKGRFNGYDVVAADGGTWFYVPPMVVFFMLLNDIVTEKENRLRLGMRLMGLTNAAHWTSWFFTSVVYTAICTATLIGSGLAFRFDFFSNSNIAVVYILFFLFGLSMSAMAFFLSTLVQKASSAQTVGYALILVGFVFQTILSSAYGALVDLLFSDDIARWVYVVRYTLIFYPPFNLSKAYYDISKLSSSTIDFNQGRIVKGKGFHWSDLYKKNSIDLFGEKMSVPATVESYYLLIMDTVVFLVLAWYLDNVLPGEHGSPRPLYFFLQPSYWIPSLAAKAPAEIAHGEAPSKDDCDDDVIAEAESAYDSQNPAEIRIMGLTKVYRKNFLFRSKNDVKAVDNLSLTAQKDEILCLLGHNGAGKTTTINCLTGLYAPTSGNATMCGHDIRDVDAVRSVLGVCPQHDILWGELTAREHLALFARLKGVPSKDVDKEITYRLDQVSLSRVQHQRVGGFSGGMKRRLSVAIAAIGDPAVIFMDEPTTGLDPVNRKAVWTLIQKLKVGRVIILTTHFMEEADVLADRITIMAQGKMRCIGNSLHLKHVYGAGYRISMTLPEGSDEAAVNKTTARVQEVVPSATLDAANAGSVAYVVPKSETTRMTGFLKQLESDTDGKMCRDWGVSHSTLEEVFLTVTKRHDFKASNDGDDFTTGEDPTTSSRPDPPPGGYTSRPYRALFRKNFALQKRQRGTNCCQIVTPVFVVLILLILQLIIRSQLGSLYDTTAVVPSIPWPLELESLDLATAKTKALYNLHDDNVQFNDINANSIEFPPPEDCLKWFAITTNGKKIPDLGASNQVGIRFGMLGQVPRSRHMCSHPGIPPFWYTTPFFLEYQSTREMDTNIFNALTTYNKLSFHDLGSHKYDWMLPDGAVEFDEVDVKGSLDYTFSVNDSPFTKYHRKNDFTRMSFKIPGVNTASLFGNKALIIQKGKLAMMDYINRAFSSYQQEQASSTSNDDDSHKPRSSFSIDFEALLNSNFVQDMPYRAAADLLVVLELFGTFLYPLALSIQLPIYVYLLVLEKADKLREMTKSMGMRMSSYYITFYLFCYVLYACVTAFFWIAGYAIKIRFFMQTSPWIMLLFFLGWGHCLICFAIFVSAFVSSKQVATVVGYIIALFGTLVSLIVTVGIYGNLKFSLPGPVPIGFSFYPQFPFARAIYLMNYACATEFQCVESLPGWHDELTRCIVFLYIDAIILLVLGLYLDAVLPRQYGVPKHPLFFLQIFGLFRTDDAQENDRENGQPAHLLESGPSGDTDRGVSDERDAVLSGGRDEDPVVVKHLRKTFASSSKGRKKGRSVKVAVKDLCVSVGGGECFGLLGENGAGKSTTINMLTGLFPPTSGSARVSGFDIQREIDSVHLTTGVCPQFNIHWNDLTVLEHLLFYARLKGIPPSQEKSHVIAAVNEVGLYQARNRQSKQLSGGMRRRLSVAMSLVGDSRVVFLDEPSTGLDPASRRQLWNILSRAKTDRAMILTTHSMDEADLLCSRVAIMAKGSIRALGTQQHLKSRFGGGHRVLINVQAGREQDAMDFVRRVLPTAELVSNLHRTFVFHLDRGTEPVSVVFEEMESSSREAGISDWGVTQFSLEDVFHNVIGPSRYSSDSDEDDLELYSTNSYVAPDIASE